MSISSTTNRASSSSSVVLSESESSPLPHGYEFFSSNDSPSPSLEDLRISDSPPYPPHLGHVPVSGDGVPDAGYSLGSSEEVKYGKMKDNGRIFILSHTGTTLHQKDVACLKHGSSEQLGTASGNFISSRSHRSGASASSQTNVGKKAQMVNGNHLLNFQYDPIPVFGPQTRVRPRRQNRVRRYNKDLFFQANYKFVVLDTGNYAAESLDPDKMLSWEDIICLKYSTPFPVSCPICLDDPLCPQITTCGHIFCFPCILQHFYIDNDDPKDEHWKKCPLCSTMISSKDLYTVRLEKVKQYHIGEEIEFALLSRRKGSFNSYLRDCEGNKPDDGFINSFTKFSFTLDVDLSVREAMSDLDGWIAKAHSGLVDDIEKLPYVSAAMEQLEQRRRHWGKRCFSNSIKEKTASYGSPTQAHANVNLGACGFTPMAVKADIMQKSSQGKIVSQLSLPPTEGLAHSPENQEKFSASSYEDNKYCRLPTSDINEETTDFSYNFYQAIDGQHVILHPFNMKCLLHHFGSPDNLPGRITGRIVELQSETQSEAIRRRYRFLSHFSLTTTFQLCEIDLGDVLPAGALSPFLEELKNREKQRKRVARKELKEKLKAEAAAKLFSQQLYYSHDATASYSMDDFKALRSPPEVELRRPPAPPQSFSAVARFGFAAAYDSPALKNNESRTPLRSHLHDSSDASSEVSVSGFRNKGADASSFASIISSMKHEQRPDSSQTNEAGKKSKRVARIILSTAGGRRY